MGFGGLIANFFVNVPLLEDTYTGTPKSLSLYGFRDFQTFLIKAIIGYTYILITRAVVKYAVLYCMKKLLLKKKVKKRVVVQNGEGETSTVVVEEEVEEAEDVRNHTYHKNYSIEIPTKILTYGSVGFSAVCLFDHICIFLGLT